MLKIVSASIDSRRSIAGVADTLISSALAVDTPIVKRIEVSIARKCLLFFHHNVQAAESLVSLARERAGAEKIIAAGL